MSGHGYVRSFGPVARARFLVEVYPVFAVITLYSGQPVSCWKALSGSAADKVLSATALLAQVAV